MDDLIVLGLTALSVSGYIIMMANHSRVSETEFIKDCVASAVISVILILIIRAFGLFGDAPLPGMVLSPLVFILVSYLMLGRYSLSGGKRLSKETKLYSIVLTIILLNIYRK